MTNNSDVICEKVRKLCEDNAIDFLFIVDGRSEWSVCRNERIREVVEFYKRQEALNDK